MQISNDILIPHIGELIQQGHTVTLPLRGYSMRPYLEDNRDKALLAPPPKELHVGDVVLAAIQPKRYALHRIVGISGEAITLYGDGNFSPEHIRQQDVIAIAKGFYRKGRNRLESTDSRAYNVYWKTWLRLRPIRRYLLALWRLYHYPRLTARQIINRFLKQ
jgi:hypothetical protein